MNDKFPLEALVELLAAHYSQSPEGTPVVRIEGRLARSLEISNKSGLTALSLHLDRLDFTWLCNARGIDRLSSAASRMRVGDVSVHRAKPSAESHIVGARDDDFPGDLRSFPIINDPSHTAGFVQHIPTDEDKLVMLEKLRAAGALGTLRDAPKGTMH